MISTHVYIWPEPGDDEYYLFRDPHDIIFLLVIFISLNADLFDKLTEFVRTDNESRDPIPIDSRIINQMRKILYTECRNGEGLGELAIFLQEPKQINLVVKKFSCPLVTIGCTSGDSTGGFLITSKDSAVNWSILDTGLA